MRISKKIINVDWLHIAGGSCMFTAGLFMPSSYISRWAAIMLLVIGIPLTLIRQKVEAK